MELLDRGVQRTLLERLGNAYPEQLDVRELGADIATNVLNVNVSYLVEHGLVHAKFTNYLSDPNVLVLARITAEGIDFLADDGGLGAILKVQTIRLHEDTVRALLIRQVEASPEDETVKSKLIDQLKALPAEGVGRLAEKALDAGLQALPSVVRWLQTTPWT